MPRPQQTALTWRMNVTKNAKYILEIINDSVNHLTAEQIYLLLKEKNKKVVLATVYNNLSFLYKEGLIRKYLLRDTQIVMTK